MATRRTNVRRIVPKEVAAVADILAHATEHDDVEFLAKDVCRAINRLRAEEALWIKVVQSGTAYHFYGVYRSPEEARADLLSAGTSKEPSEFRLYSLIPPFGGADGHEED